MPPGKLIVLSAPSGAGKTTVAREIMKLNPELEFSVSATTRVRRQNEVEGRDYYFLSREEFLRRVEAGEFVEWEEMYGDCYGTLKEEIERVLRKGGHLLFDVDVKGALSIKRKYPRALLIFIAPPSMAVLEQRLRGRKTENETTVARRLDRVPMEMEKRDAFDRQVVNDDLRTAVGEVDRIVKQHLRSELTRG